MLFTARHDRKNGKRALVALLPLLAVLFLSAPAHANERQYKIEAAYLYNFFNYVTWPGHTSPESLRNATICVYGNDPVQPYLEYIGRKKVAERTLTVRRIEKPIKLNECHIFFMREVGSEDRDYLKSLAITTNTLFVSETRGFVDAGGMIGMNPEAERVALEMHNTNIKHAQLQMSSRLLELARKVK